MNTNALQHYSKLICFAVLGLIFLGALVTSHDAGLSVPDWPQSYGYNMFLFPISKWIGGIFYEHTHRLLASFIGILTVILTIWVHFKENQKWIKQLSLFALFLVIVQGVLGGLTVLWRLPTAVSVAHAMTAQTFLVVLTIIAWGIAQSKSLSWKWSALSKGTLVTIIGLYIQLLLGALMRHTASGLAIPDFPTMGGSYIPSVAEPTIVAINSMRSELNLIPVTSEQVLIHLLHRIWGILLSLHIIGFGFKVFRSSSITPAGRSLSRILIGLVIIQFLLGILTVMSLRSPFLTSFHVVTGAILLGGSVLLFLETGKQRKGVRRETS